MRRGSHAPFRRAVGIHHGQARLGQSRGEGGVPEDLLGDVALSRHRAGLGEGHAGGLGRGIFLQPLDILGQRIDRRRAVDAAAAADRGADRAAILDPDTPFIDRQAVRNALVGFAGHRQPSVGEAPAQRRVLLAIVHMAVDLHAIDLLHVVGEEVGDVLVGRPVDRHAELVAVLRLELVLEVGPLEPVGAEPVEVGELLVGQLVELAVGRGGEALADEVVDVEGRQRDVLALAGHEVRQRNREPVAEVGADQVTVVDVHVVDVLARLHLGLQLLDDVTLLDDVVLQIDAGDLAERLRERLGLVDVGVDRFGHHVDVHALEGRRGVDEELHLGHLLVFGQRAGMELVGDPLLGHRDVGPGLERQRAGPGHDGRGRGALQHGPAIQHELRTIPFHERVLLAFPVGVRSLRRERKVGPAPRSKAWSRRPPLQPQRMTMTR